MRGLLKRKVRGSLTVEASLVVPIVIFLVIAAVYLFFYQHDKVLLQSYADYAGEVSLYESTSGSTGQSEVSTGMIMMRVDGYSDNTEGSTLTQKLVSLLTSWQKDTVSLSGNVGISIPGTALFTGSYLKAEVSGTTVRVSYVDDWMKKHVLVK